MTWFSTVDCKYLSFIWRSVLKQLSRKGVVFGNQQFTVRNLTFYNAVTAIDQIWDWGWTYKGINIYNCSVGLDFSSGGSSGQSVGSITFIDSSITNTPVGFLTAHSETSLPPTAGSLILENVQLNNVPVAVQGPGSATYLAGSSGSMKIAAWAQGHSYTPTGPVNIMGPIGPFPRPGSLLEDGGKFYERSKPQYATVPVSQFSSVRDGGAKGDGVTDDTAALTTVIAQAAKSRKIVFFDAGTYKVTSTLYIPSGSKIVGESYPNIMGSGSFFSDMSKPQPIIRVGTTHERGSIEWSDMIVSTQGATAGAILIEFNLASSSSAPSGIWDVHARIGGFAGSSKLSYS
jgi:glucan 1,3-beta-glucosidase